MAHTIESKREFVLAWLASPDVRLTVEEGKLQGIRVYECACEYEHCAGLVAWSSWPNEYSDNPMTLDELGL